MGRAKFYSWLATQKEKTGRRVARRGLAAGQFHMMAQLLKIKLPRKTPSYITKNQSTQSSIVKPTLKPRITSGTGITTSIILESKGLRISGPTQAQYHLMRATAARQKLFTNAVRKEYIKDIKTYMPKNYPLLFR